MAKILGNGLDGGTAYGPTETELVKRLGDEQLRDRAIGQGSTRTGTLAGKQNAVWSEVNLTGLASLTDVKVPHALGSAPVLCELVEARNAGGPVYAQVVPVAKEKWSATVARVSVTLNGGAQAGTVLKFRVGGA